MNEASWNPLELLARLRDRFALRKVRLFLLACAQQAEGPLDERWQPFLDASERYERGELPRDEYEKICSDLGGVQAAMIASQLALAPASAAPLRDIFGSPFQAPVVEPAWLDWNDGTVRRIAARIHVERRFEELPILADALEEAGCTNEPLLSHARGPGPHYRGCWLLELLSERGR